MFALLSDSNVNEINHEISKMKSDSKICVLSFDMFSVFADSLVMDILFMSINRIPIFSKYAFTYLYIITCNKSTESYDKKNSIVQKQTVLLLQYFNFR